jgi:hypothetical protein
MKFKLLRSVTHFPRSTSRPASLPPGTIVTLVTRKSATLLLVTLKDPEETFPVLASEVEALILQPA